MREALQRGGEYCLFFRFRSGIGYQDLKALKPDKNRHWLFQSLQYIDYSKGKFLTECFIIGFASKGSFSPEYLGDLDWDEFNDLLLFSQNLIKAMQGKPGG
jgi:hypothetical protein